jgi:AraC-like DNA-binding protein
MTALAAADLMLRGGVCLLLLLVAGLLVRDYRDRLPARLGALFALGSVAFALVPVGGLVPAVIAGGNNVVFWLFARALFDDDFRLQRGHVALWLGMLAATMAGNLVPHGDLYLAACIALALVSLGFALLAVAQAVTSWREDLVEGRRRVRLFLVGASGIYILLTTTAAVLGLDRTAPANLIGAVGLAAIAGAVAWALLRIDGAPLFPAAAARPAPAETSSDQRLVARLHQEMEVERRYRQEGLSIGALAAALGLPEYRLRRLINGELGYRNFAAFLNHYRLADARAALADPTQAEVPILTIALDAGFNSLGPFNRAFKAETGMTPSEYRRTARPGHRDAA